MMNKVNNLRITVFAALLSVTAIVCGQTPSSSQNYVMTKQVFVEGQKTQSNVSALPSGSQASSIQYFDGLGRLLQHVQYQAGSGITPEDIITPYAYDSFGRQEKSYIQYATTASGAFIPTAITDLTNYRNNPSDPTISDAGAFPYALSVFDDTPLNRVLKQGAPGAAWQPSGAATNLNDNTVKFQYGTNGSNEVRMLTGTNGAPFQFVSNQHYPSGSLTKLTSYDEDNNKTEVFTDHLGRTILRRNEVDGTDHDTYYVYDDLGRLNTVISPEGMRAFVSGGDVISGESPRAVVEAGGSVSFPNGNTGMNNSGATFYESNYGTIVYRSGGSVTLGDGFHFVAGLEGDPRWELTIKNSDDQFEIFDNGNIVSNYTFQYEYDERGRLIKKHVPGAGWTHMIYDDRNRLRMTQDENQRANNQWMFYKYDAFDREVQSGFYTTTASMSTLQSSIGSETHEFESRAGTLKHYSNNTFPTAIAEADLVSVSLYDNYEVFSTGIYVFNHPFTSDYIVEPTGLQTGGYTKVLGTSQWIKSVMYYDHKYRVLQITTDNHVGSYTRVSSEYNFPGWITRVRTEHVTPEENITLNERYTYDDMGRMLDHFHQIGSADEERIASNTYNDLGELIEKDLHDGQQSLDYRYNVRGWLISVNESNLSASTDHDLFGFELLYDQVDGAMGNTSHYNGNISAMRWSDPAATGANNTRAFNYTYDELNRLKSASHFENNISTNKFSVSGIAYDRNGNIETLKRRSTSTSDYMDDLAYSYVGNQLTKVDDSGDDAEGFKESGTGTDYAYDANGNMTADANKGITDITYNHLNLPVKVTFDAQNYIDYLYDASGNKLQQKVTQGGTVAKITDYVGGFIYEDVNDGSGRNLELIQHAEGRLMPYSLSGTGIDGFDYQYHLKDHLGNVRMTFEVVEYTSVEDFEGGNNGFYNLGNVATDLLLNTTSGGTKLQALPIGSIGAMTMLAVKSGDKVDINVNGTYEPISGGNPVAAVSAVAVFNAFNATPIPGNEGVTPIQGEFSDAIGGAEMLSKSEMPLGARGFINYILFDANMNYVTAGFRQLSHIDQGGGPYNPQNISINDISPQQEGYMLIYLTNENTQNALVFFDDLTVNHTTKDVVQTDDYYPFGLTFNSTSKPSSRGNRFLLSGNEKLEDWGIGVFDFNARMYDAGIGRFMSVDPLADAMVEWNPYHYNFNNPLRFIDPGGMYPAEMTEEEELGPRAGQMIEYTNASISVGRNGIQTSGTYATKDGGSSGDTGGGSSFMTTQQKKYNSAMAKHPLLFGSGSSFKTKIDKGGYWNGFLNEVGDILESTFRFFTGDPMAVAEVGVGTYSAAEFLCMVCGDEVDARNKAKAEAVIQFAENIPNMSSYQWGGVTAGIIPTLITKKPSFRWLFDSPYKTVLRTPFKRNGRYLSGFQFEGFRFQLHKHRINGSSTYLPHMNFNNVHLMLNKKGIDQFGFIFRHGKK